MSVQIGIRLRRGATDAAEQGVGNGPESDLDQLIRRIRHRLYPDTISVLGSYWLKTIYPAGHELKWWKQLDRLLKAAISVPLLDDPSRQVLAEIRDWVEQTILATGHPPKCPPLPPDLYSTSLPPIKLAPYIVRLLNQWLPVEVARLLVQESETGANEKGIPVLATARALERLLIRERLSRPVLEALLEPELVSPAHVYPKDMEILRDVLLSLVGRTSAPDPPVTPASLFCVAPDCRLPSDFKQLLSHACIVRRSESDELRVPISASDTARIMSDDRVCIGSMIVTSDGRWWKSENIDGGERNWVVYRPLRRFEVDYSGEYSKIRVPWPENRLPPFSNGRFTDTFQIFGREWRIAKLEIDAEYTWLHLRFSRFLSISETMPAAAASARDLPPASVEMAWSAVEATLKSSVRFKNTEAIEKLRNPDLIPLARALFRFTQCLLSRGRKLEVMELQLQALRYLQSSVAAEYGRIPWGVLPGPVRAAFLKVESWPAISGLLNEVFNGLPEVRPESHQKTT